MYLPDINVWVALAHPAHAHHGKARIGFDGAPGDRLCHFCRITQMGLLRIVNNPKAIPNYALTQDEAWKIYDHFRSHPRVAFADEPAGVEARWRQSTELPRFSTSLWNDAYLAAFAQASDFEIVTLDRGFVQFANLKVTILQ